MQGSFTLPQKFLKGWSWEKGWLVYSLAGMILFPWLLIAATIPQPFTVYSNVSGSALALTAVFGAGWGIGSVLFGLAVAQVGMALAFAVIISVTAAVGSLVPLIVLHPQQAFSSRGVILVIGLLIVAAGVTLCARAGALREGSQSASGAGGGKFLRGLLISILSGVTSPMFNLGLAFGSSISDQAVKQGANAASASTATLAVAIGSGFLINAGYCIYLLNKNKSWGGTVPASTGKNVVNAMLMGFLWFFGMAAYGYGSTFIGSMGTVIGWPVFMTIIVLVANFWGIRTGEWKHANPVAYRYLKMGNAVMILAILVIAWGSRA